MGITVISPKALKQNWCLELFRDVEGGSKLPFCLIRTDLADELKDNRKLEQTRFITITPDAFANEYAKAGDVTPFVKKYLENRVVIVDEAQTWIKHYETIRPKQLPR